jgi:hypothetical protein
MEHFEPEMYCGTQILFDDFNREQYMVVLIEHIGPVFGHEVLLFHAIRRENLCLSVIDANGNCR